MEHVVTGQVLGRGTDRDATFEDLQPDVRPFAYRLKVDTAVNQRLSKISSTGPQRVGANGHWTWDLVGLKELNSLCETDIRIL